MKRLIIACALVAAVIAPSVFAGEPKLPADISTWESHVLKCTPKPGVELTVAIYTKKPENNRDIIETFDIQGKRVAQLEFILGDTDAIKFTVQKKEGWVTHNFTGDKDESAKLAQEFETALGISMEDYFSCIK
jgi:hypothetical protein